MTEIRDFPKYITVKKSATKMKAMSNMIYIFFITNLSCNIPLRKSTPTLLTSASLDRFPRNNHMLLGDRNASIKPKNPPVITVVSSGMICSAMQFPDDISNCLYIPPRWEPGFEYHTANPADVICKLFTVSAPGGSEMHVN